MTTTLFRTANNIVGDYTLDQTVKNSSSVVEKTSNKVENTQNVPKATLTATGSGSTTLQQTGKCGDWRLSIHGDFAGPAKE